jgi:hypothetical protein
MRLDTVQEIERAIDALTPQQLEELYLWLDQHHPQPIDAQLKADLEAGRIDDRINRTLDARLPVKRRGACASSIWCADDPSRSR